MEWYIEILMFSSPHFDAHCEYNLSNFNRFSEPTGNLSPKTPGEKYEGGKLISSANKKNVYIVCNVIGFPIPVYRYVINLVLSG